MLARALLFLPALWLIGCAESANEPQPQIAEAYYARCGSCHARVEPHSRTRAELENALPRHRNRAHLTDDEWKQLEDYLSSDPPREAKLAR